MKERKKFADKIKRARKNATKEVKKNKTLVNSHNSKQT